MSEIVLADNRYGKAAIRLVRVDRTPGHHTIKDVTVRVALEGAFDDVHTAGDNSPVVATDTMRNTAYAFARDHLDRSIEAYGRALARHFAAFPQVSRATVTIDEQRWQRLVGPDGPSDHAFVRAGDLTRLAEVQVGADGVEQVEAGVAELTLLKTTHSAFSGFDRDRFTTLADTEDRLLATRLSARWRYGAGRAMQADAEYDFDGAFDAVLACLLEVFAAHHSPSVQSTIWQLGQAVLSRRPEIDEIRFVLPNLHHWPADLAPFGMTNDKVVYVATSEPRGVIEGTIRRS
ncbi:MAG TPA: urate oxidase [Candidatus Limnocylindrales bacterium]